MNTDSSVCLREMTEDDLPMVLSWRNRESVRNNMYTNHVISEEEHQRWWDSQSANPKTRLLVAVLGDTEVGVVTFTNYTGKNGLATWAFYAGDSAAKGVGSMMEVAALKYAFSELAIRKLECQVLDFNMPVVNLHLKHGFKVEGILRDAYERGGSYHDIYCLALMSGDWAKYIYPLIRESGGRKVGLAGSVFKKEVLITSEMVEAFSEAVGDRNPVHFDDEYARNLGFSSRIAHGMLVGSLFSDFFASDFPGPGTVYLSQTLSFLLPVFVGEAVELRLRVLTHAGRRLTIETKCCRGQEVCMEGQAVVLAPKGTTVN